MAEILRSYIGVGSFSGQWGNVPTETKQPVISRGYSSDKPLQIGEHVGKGIVVSTLPIENPKGDVEFASDICYSISPEFCKTCSERGIDCKLTST